MIDGTTGLPAKYGLDVKWWLDQAGSDQYVADLFFNFLSIVLINNSARSGESGDTIPISGYGLESIIVTKSWDANNPWFALDDYLYNSSGDMTGYYSGENPVETYTYNALAMLETASGPYSGGAYEYYDDPLGNRTTSVGDGPATTTPFTYNYQAGTNLLTDVNAGVEYTTDAYGNIALYDDGTSTMSFLYHLNGQLSQVYDYGSATNLITNFYDHLGQRYLQIPTDDPPVMYQYDIAGRMISEMHLTDTSQEDLDDGTNPVLDYVYLGGHRVAVLTGLMNPGQAPSGCFVATAAYGTTMSVDIQALRDLRERVLKKAAVGLAFVNWYYRNGPRYARWPNDNPNTSIFMNVPRCIYTN